jgi:hypothetical protein
MEGFLAQRARGATLAVGQAPYTMLGTIVQHEPGVELVTRRQLHLDEDTYVHDHALGGGAVSRVDLHQHGSAVQPMTFSLETMAEAASVLLPQLKVIAIENVQLNRWIGVEEDKPTVLEIHGKVLPAAEQTPATVHVAVYDLGDSPDNPRPGRPAAEAIVLLAPDYPKAPPSVIELQDDRPCQITRESLYKRMFHGPLFRGIMSADRVDERSITGTVLVPGRDHWFRSTAEPSLVLDPVLLDMTMHVLAGWHLEQPDQAGRILLPFKLERVEFFGPMPGEGELLPVRGTMDRETARNVKHRVELLGSDGRLIYRMTGVWYWRFYLPNQDQINFHSPKDEYFMSARCPQAEPVGAASCCMVLQPPADLDQPLLQASLARVALAPDELRHYFGLGGTTTSRIDWLFGRLAVKDAVRRLWHEQTGERLMPADLVLDLEPASRTIVRPRDPARTDVLPAACKATAGGKMVSFATTQGRPGLAAAVVPADAEVALDAEEKRLLQQWPGDRVELLTRIDCARRAVVQALAGDQIVSGTGVAVHGGDPATGLLLVALGPALAQACPEYRLDLLQVQTACQDGLVIATTLCQRAVS